VDFFFEHFVGDVLFGVRAEGFAEVSSCWIRGGGRRPFRGRRRLRGDRAGVEGFGEVEAGMERPEPWPWPLLRATMMAGRLNLLTMREATMPMTPGCQFSEARTMPRQSGCRSEIVGLIDGFGGDGSLDGLALAILGFEVARFRWRGLRRFG